MINWIKTSDRLPPFRVRVLIWTKDSRLLDWNNNLVRVYVMERIPQQMYGNHRVDYSWRCENSGWEYGDNVEYWAGIEAPNAK